MSRYQTGHETKEYKNYHKQNFTHTKKKQTNKTKQIWGNLTSNLWLAVFKYYWKVVSVQSVIYKPSDVSIIIIIVKWSFNILPDN